MAKSSFWADFKAFAMKGNVIDMAIGIVIGAAFGKIITSLVNDLIMPALGGLLGAFNFTDLKVVLCQAVMNGEEVVKPAVSLNYGNFIQEVVNFLIIALSIFLVIRAFMKLRKKKEEEPAAAAPAPRPDDVVLLEEIRDLLKTEK
ncbi:MAG: large-conductance mechanosensitive channel protein MscL [Candidatus Cryptobacteroides sp.]|jgi:large conductance mechanosensitive channel|nr:large-conductance mechanosensitive channel protein MscL [Bacteroidota bacterium]NLN99469.1 large-conductance mechanosensitive channel protein MscL [Bacteroidales bacterium]